jgi:iron complex outermembrane receptor protein
MKGKNQVATYRATKSTVAIAVATALASPMAIAQQDGGNDLVIDEVIVTATKRESSMQDLAVSITAISGDRINELSLYNVLDIDKTVPGLKIRYIGADPTIIMRGAGAAGTNDIAVPMYVDSLYRPRAGQALASYLDLERVEVLRGPQGTLFGRNTFGGLINYITKKPSTDAFDFGVGATFGDYSAQKYEGFVNIPMGDSVALRISASDTQRDPLIKNVYDKNGGMRDEDNSYVRAQLRFEPNDTFNITLAGTSWEDTSNGNADYAGVILGIPVNPTTGLTDGINGVLQPRAGRLQGQETDAWPIGGGRTWAGVFGVDDSATVLSDEYQITNDTKPVRDIEETSFSVLANYDFGPVVLTVNYGSFDYEEFRTADSDYSANPAQWGIDNPGVAPPVENGPNFWQQCWDGPSCGRLAGQRLNSKAQQADINLNSNTDGPLQWTLGYFYYDDSGDGDTSSEFTWAYVDVNEGTATNVSWAHWMSQGNGGTKSTAIYGQAEYSFTDRTRATLGLRESTDERRSFTKYVDWGSAVHGWAAGYYEAHLVDPGSRFDPWPKYVATDSTWANEARGKKSNTDYKVALQHDLGDSVMLFGSIASGYIAGGIEGGAGGSNTLTQPNEVETVEVGIKSSLLDGSMQLNVSVYQNDYDGLTTSAFEACGGSICAVSVVSGSMDATGLELEMDWIASDALRIRAGLALTDVELDKFGRSVLNRVFRSGGDEVQLGELITDPALCDETCSQIYILDGKPARFSPDWTLSVDASYEIDLGSAGTLVPGILIYHSDDYSTTNVPYFFAQQDAYTTYDLRATWYAETSPLSVQAFVLNASDEVVQIGSDQFSQGRVIADFNNPTIWGMRVSYNF